MKLYQSKTWLTKRYLVDKMDINDIFHILLYYYENNLFEKLVKFMFIIQNIK